MNRFKVADNASAFRKTNTLAKVKLFQTELGHVWESFVLNSSKLDVWLVSKYISEGVHLSRRF